jgi:cobalt-zinc-cadmium efflux system protein
MDVASVHLMAASEADVSTVLEAAQHLLRDEFGISHATIQVEAPGRACDERSW